MLRVDKVSLNLGDVDDLSMSMLQLMEENTVNYDMAQAATALTLARLCSPEQPLTEDKAIPAIQGILQYATLYFHEGDPN